MAEDPELEDPVEEHSAHARHDDMPPHARLGGLRRRGIYLLPNLFTTGVLFCGFFAIVQAMNQRFEVGAIAIFVAMVLDGMDGRVARWGGSSPSSTAPARGSASRASTRTSRSSTSAISRACRARRARR